MQIVLASTSPYRKQLLTNAGIPFKAMSPKLDEQPFKQKGLSPKALAATLAKEKAAAVAEQLSKDDLKTSIVIGSDQVACLGDLIFNKPGSMEKAQQVLSKLSGQTHELITSVCLITDAKEEVFTNITKLKMRALEEPAIRAYLEEDKPFDCSGSYKLESAGIRLFESIDSNDFTAIQGLPMINLCSRLLALGFPLL